MWGLNVLVQKQYHNVNVASEQDRRKYDSQLAKYLHETLCLAGYLLIRDFDRTDYAKVRRQTKREGGVGEMKEAK